MATTVASASAEAWLRRARNALIGLLCTVWAALAAAHPMPESRVWIDATPDGLKLTLQLPLNRLEYGYGQPLADYASTLLAQHADGLSRYLLQHASASSSGLAWQASPPRLEVQGNNASAELQAVLELHAPAGADPRSPTLHYDAITHEVRTHRVMVFLRNDWAGGFAGQAPLLLGELSHGHDSLAIPLVQARSGSTVLRLVRDGAAHIAQGTDHLLFLVLLLLVAPLAASAGRWSEVRPVTQALRHTGLVVTAFTIGHTVTLVLGSTGTLSVPARPVEVAVALTIAVAAVHAWRPLFGHADAWMALGFGLVHGMAFSASLTGAGLTAGQHAQALLAFNLGIEAMQLIVLIGVLPPLFMLCRTAPALHADLRRVVSIAAAALAGLWLVERLGFDALIKMSSIDDAAWAVALLAAVFWLLALSACGRHRRRCVAASRGG